VLGIERRFTELCIFEILASDNQTVEEALAAYNESLQLNGTDDDGPSSLAELMYSPIIRQILEAAASQVCPGQPACTGRGTCTNSTCTCDTGKHTFMPPEDIREVLCFAAVLFDTQTLIFHTVFYKKKEPPIFVRIKQTSK